MVYSVKIAEAVRTFLDGDHWNYKFQEETGVFKFMLSLDSKLKQAGFLIQIGETGYVLRAVCMLGAKDCLPQMAEFLHRANYGLKEGNFELNYQNGEVGYKYYVNCAETIPTQKQVERSIYLPAMMLEQYGNGIVAVSFQIMTPEEAIETCEHTKQ